MPPATATAPSAGGVIHADAAYTLDDLKEFGFGTWAVRMMRRRGMPVRRYGRRSFVLGRDLIAEIERGGKVVQ